MSLRTLPREDLTELYLEQTLIHCKECMVGLVEEEEGVGEVGEEVASWVDQF